MAYTVELRDENNNCAVLQAEDWSSVDFLGQMVAAAAATEDYRQFQRHGSLTVLDDTGAEVAHTDRSTAWSLPEDPQLKRDQNRPR
ncbi:hypothetical protein K2O51_31700 (plasmid) [Cupriavidus pinatubonensis]|uniref:hypothetical protein n=1 Tax=Cupriavidus pinatubonensis TaxID=248026 RepID=UPI001C734177|nr:hypothetical protein [Cupriavidus pinatubonensis]QYY33591.1 hypothetical protein K2O51_31700 [Cupriavidus pinatubonensis]